MDKDKKVSIIIPVYKAEAYLDRCLKTAVNQTYSNIEIILIDDGSPDRSGEICDDYAGKDNRIIVLHQKNQGQSVARNNALKIASGQYYLFMDADDSAPLYMVESLLKSCINYDAQIAIGDYKMFTDSIPNEQGQVHDERISSYKGTELIPLMHTVPGEKYVVMWGKMFEASLFKGIRFPEGRICEDLAVLYRLYDTAIKIVITDLPVYWYYRANENSSTFALKDKFYTDVYLALDEEIDYLRKAHPEYVQYAAKTYMYWLKDEYMKLFYLREGKEKRNSLHKRYRGLYKEVNMKVEKFYHFFRFFPTLYCTVKK